MRRHPAYPHSLHAQFDARCLEFVLDFFGAARDAFYGPVDGPRRDLSLTSPIAQYNGQNPLFLKQSVIVLREELEYFAIPPGRASATAADHPGTDDAGKPNAALSQLKIDCGTALLEHRSIFTALQRNVSRDNNVAEQHLIDMLCMSGFERDDSWGYRSLEPTRCCIASIALVLLKTGIVHPPIGGSGGSGSAPASRPTRTGRRRRATRAGRGESRSTRSSSRRRRSCSCSGASPRCAPFSSVLLVLASCR